MNKNSKDFINLISSFLNSSKPENHNYDWNEIYKLAKINDVTAIVAQESKLLSDNYKPQNRFKSILNQCLGLTLREYCNKLEVKEILQVFFSYNKIDYIFAKGIVLQEFYPQPELRTSGDIDVIVRDEKYEEVCKTFKNSNYIIDEMTSNTLVLNIQNVMVEIHKGADVYSKYFENIFDMCTNDEYEYKLDDYLNLLYVILHLVKHLKSFGAGIRMLMDIDVCIRAINDFNEDKIIEMCENAGIKKCGQMLLSLCSFWFDTPVRQYVDFNKDENRVNLLEKSFLYGGTFGFKNNNLGSYYMVRSADGKVGIKEKIKAIISMILPPVSVLQNAYHYSAKCKILIPVAFLNRLFDGIFKRGTHSLNTAKQIVNSNEEALFEAQVLKELEIKID